MEWCPAGEWLGRDWQQGVGGHRHLVGVRVAATDAFGEADRHLVDRRRVERARVLHVDGPVALGGDGGGERRRGGVRRREELQLGGGAAEPVGLAEGERAHRAQHVGDEAGEVLVVVGRRRQQRHRPRPRVHREEER